MILLMGVAGAGKSMQGRMLADEYGYSWISTGEILRVLITGKRRQEMLQGKLLSDEEVIRVLDKVADLIDKGQEFVLDGFPRTTKQTDWLLDQVHKGRFKTTAVIHLFASEDVVKDRLKARGRQDDSEEAISERFDEYEKVTKPILNHFKEEGVKVFEIDASQSPEEVHSQIVKIINQK